MQEKDRFGHVASRLATHFRWQRSLVVSVKTEISNTVRINSSSRPATAFNRSHVSALKSDDLIRVKIKGTAIQKRAASCRALRSNKLTISQL